MALLTCPRCRAAVAHSPGTRPACPTCGFPGADVRAPEPEPAFSNEPAAPVLVTDPPPGWQPADWTPPYAPQKKGLGVGAIVGIVVGGVALLVLVAALIIGLTLSDNALSGDPGFGPTYQSSSPILLVRLSPFVGNYDADAAHEVSLHLEAFDEKHTSYPVSFEGNVTWSFAVATDEQATQWRTVTTLREAVNETSFLSPYNAVLVHDEDDGTFTDGSVYLARATIEVWGGGTFEDAQQFTYHKHG